MGSVRDLHGVPMEFVRGPHGTGKGFVWGSYGLAIEKSLRRGRKASPSAGHALRGCLQAPAAAKPPNGDRARDFRLEGRRSNH